MSRLYDLESVRELAGGDEDFVQVLVQTFLEEIPPDVDSMQQAIQNGNNKMAYQFAHKMKPNLQLFNIDVIHHIKAIESWSNTTESSSSVSTEIDAIISTISKVIDQLKEDF